MSKHWGLLSDDMIDGWNSRSRKLNNRPFEGQCLQITSLINGTRDITIAMTLDWKEITKKVQNYIAQVPRQRESAK